MKTRIAMSVSLTPSLSQREREIRSAFGAYFHSRLSLCFSRVSAAEVGSRNHPSAGSRPDSELCCKVVHTYE